jgi:hypothetical protein
MSGPEPPYQSALFGLITGYHLSCAVYVAARLGIADLLADGPSTCAALASATHTHASSLNRVLRLLVSAGVLTEDDDARFGLAPIGECLRSDAPDSMRAVALLWGGRPQLAWGRLLHCVQTGKPAFARVFGTDPFGHMFANRDAADVFDEGMAAVTRHTATAVAAAYDFSRFTTIVDVGGGNGALLAGILSAYPPVRGILFDVPHVVARAEQRLTELGVGDRCRTVGGSFLENVPSGGDAYVLSNVLTDWTDEDATTILQRCHAAMTSNATLLILEAVYPSRIDHSAESRAAASTDVNVMVCTGGRERSEAEFRELCHAAGFELSRIVRTSSRVCVIEGQRT